MSEEVHRGELTEMYSANYTNRYSRVMQSFQAHLVPPSRKLSGGYAARVCE